MSCKPSTRVPRSLTDLRRETGSPPVTTMRVYLRELAATGIVEKVRENDFPGSLRYELTSVGRDLVEVTAALRSWLATSPEGGLTTGSATAKSATKAMIEAWSTNIMRALAARALTLTELDSLITNVSYPSLERRLTSMHLAGQLKKAPTPGRGTPYLVTDWLRRAIWPLAAAARWERRHLGEQSPPITSRDIEAAFLLAIPLLRLPADLSGSCRLAVELKGNDRLAGVMVGVERGRIASCTSRLGGDPNAQASGNPSAWLTALLERDVHLLKCDGESRLAEAVVLGMRQALSGQNHSFP